MGFIFKAFLLAEREAHKTEKTIFCWLGPSSQLWVRTHAPEYVQDRAASEADM